MKSSVYWEYKIIVATLSKDDIDFVEVGKIKMKLEKKMIARKCDRCGNLFEQKIPRIILKVIYTEFVGSMELPHWDYDLCPNCQDLFRDWWVAGRAKTEVWSYDDLIKKYDGRK